MKTNAMNMETTTKPKTVRAIFILNAFKILLSLGFFLVFSYTDVSISGLDPTFILYTSLGYTLMFIAMVLSILNKSIWGLRISIILDFLISVPVVAVIGFVISILSFYLTFRPTAKAYFQ